MYISRVRINANRCLSLSKLLLIRKSSLAAAWVLSAALCARESEVATGHGARMEGGGHACPRSGVKKVPPELGLGGVRSGRQASGCFPSRTSLGVGLHASANGPF